MSFKKAGIIFCLGVVGFVFVIILTGCKEETKSVDYYMQHDEARMEKLKECHNASTDSENCRNATEAMNKLQKKNTSIPHF